MGSRPLKVQSLPEQKLIHWKADGMLDKFYNSTSDLRKFNGVGLFFFPGPGWGLQRDHLLTQWVSQEESRGVISNSWFLFGAAAQITLPFPFFAAVKLGADKMM